MKRLLLLLIIPTLSYSQTYSDIMNMNSEKNFIKTMIENGYEFDYVEDSRLINYGLNIEKDVVSGNKSSSWCSYDTQSEEFGLLFYRSGIEIIDKDNPYDIIVKKIKNRCKYYDILNFVDIDFVCYSCPESTYKGKIGFVVSEGRGLIRHFIPTED